MQPDGAQDEGSIKEPTMSYLHNLLGEGEEIVFTTRQHWFIPLAHILTELIVLAILVLVAIVVPAVFPTLPEGMVYLGTVALGLIVVLSAFGDIMRWHSCKACSTKTCSTRRWRRSPMCNWSRAWLAACSTSATSIF
jgi:hypothetical protein